MYTCVQTESNILHALPDDSFICCEADEPEIYFHGSLDEEVNTNLRRTALKGIFTYDTRVAKSELQTYASVSGLSATAATIERLSPRTAAQLSLDKANEQQFVRIKQINVLCEPTQLVATA